VAEYTIENARLDILPRVLRDQTVRFRRDCVDLLSRDGSRALAVLRPGQHFVSVAVLSMPMKPEADSTRKIPYGGPAVTFRIAEAPSSIPPERDFEVVDVTEGAKRISAIASGAVVAGL
jgi:hypothetical protein